MKLGKSHALEESRETNGGIQGAGVLHAGEGSIHSLPALLRPLSARW